MHEGVFTEQIVEAILAEIKKHPGKRPSAVKVRVGEVFHLIPESVQLHFQTQTKGTSLEGVRLELIEEPMRVVCPDCGTFGAVEDHHLAVCSKCYSRNVRIVSGNSVVVEAIELNA